MFSEERTSWEKEMLIREAIEDAEKNGFVVHLRHSGRIIVPPDSPCIDIILYGLEKVARDAHRHERARMTFIDFMYYWHERLFKSVKRNRRQK